MELSIALATSRVFCRSPPGSVHPAATAGLAGPPAAPAEPPAVAEPPAAPTRAAVAALVKQPGVLELLVLLLPQPPMAS
ncbi:MAG TPA: hypothetical protein VGF32_08660, partial [Streptosporangiaceae bacterium]